MESANIGVSREEIQGIVKILNTLLADETILYTKTRNYHWNVTGLQFRALHELFEEQYEALAETIDKIAELIRTYGANAIGTLTEYGEITRLEERPGHYPDSIGMIADLLADHEMIIRCLREDIEDIDDEYDEVSAEDFLTGLMEDHLKTAWMLRAMLPDNNHQANHAAGQMTTEVYADGLQEGGEEDED
jgi:starvation-inducible DNA-binding protein